MAPSFQETGIGRQWCHFGTISGGENRQPAVDVSKTMTNLLPLKGNFQEGSFLETRLVRGKTMKRFFVAVACCALFGLNVSAQEPVQAVAESVIAADCGCDQAAPVAAPVALPVATVPAVPYCCENETTRLQVVTRVRDRFTSIRERVGFDRGTEVCCAPVAQPTFVQAACGCAQPAPVVDYVSAPVAVAPVADFGCGQPAPVVNYVAAPIAVAPACDVCAEVVPAVDYCCETGRTRPQVINRVRGRLTSVRTSVQARVGEFRNNDECCY